MVGDLTPAPLAAPPPVVEPRASLVQRFARVDVVIAGLAVFMLLTRFVMLDRVPLGFYVDEASTALNALCISQSGTNQSGLSWPLFFPEFGGWLPPTSIYWNALWTTLFGPSVAAFRASAAFVSCFTALGLFMLARLFLTPLGARFVLLSAAISPPLFQFSRIAWECYWMPCCLVWSMYFFFRSPRFRDAMAAGLLAGITCYTYLAGRAMVPLLTPVLLYLWVKRHGFRWKPLAALSAVFVVTIGPLAYFTLNGTLMARANSVGIFADDYLSPYQGPKPVVALSFFIENLLSHFTPRFLLTFGDDNRRHGTQFFGELSWLDVFALLCGVLLGVRHLVGTRENAVVARPGLTRTLWFMFLAYGILCGFTPSSLTHDGPPHALRSIGAWPMFCLLTGTLMEEATAVYRRAPMVASGVALAFMVFFVPTYLYRYPVVSSDWFEHSRAVEFRAARGNPTKMRAVVKKHDRLGLRYLVASEEGVACRETDAWLDKAQQ